KRNMEGKIFGPVPSRRLGNSLGVDIIPYKTCTFDCVYCELGKTTCRSVSRKNFYPASCFMKELEEYVPFKNVDCLTVTGSGEPTLYKGLDTLCKTLKDKTGLPLVLLTNASLLGRPEVVKEILLFDSILPSLDAVTPEVFRKINRPHPSLKIENIIRGLKRLRERFRGKIFLEVLFVKGFNDRESELKALKNAIEYIAPDRVDLNTVVRPPAEKKIFPVPERYLDEVRSYMGDYARVIGTYCRKKIIEMNGNSLKELIKHRPMSMGELKNLTGKDKPWLETALQELVKSGQIKKNRDFYVWTGDSCGP
ncbi:MAG TPA: radical SAM protein, partial [bacterium]|nr:radical SAM protein [bacterium]